MLYVASLLTKYIANIPEVSKFECQGDRVLARFLFTNITDTVGQISIFWSLPFKFLFGSFFCLYFFNKALGICIRIS